MNSIPVGRAVGRARDRVFVLQVGRVERPLEPPTRPWEVARVSFEIARRHRFHREMAEIPDGVARTCCRPAAARAKDDSMLAYRSFDAVTRARWTRPTRRRGGTCEEHAVIRLSAGSCVAPAMVAADRAGA